MPPPKKLKTKQKNPLNFLQKMLFSYNQKSFTGKCHFDHKIKRKPFDYLIHVASVKNISFHCTNILFHINYLMLIFPSEHVF